MDSLKEYLAEGGVVLDVRTREEVAQGANPVAINIPVSELGSSLSRLDKAQPVIVCCASGGRSAAARKLLMQNGFDNVLDVGPWRNSIDSAE
ncbi:MAG: rhodanese-like domain-containing protein [Myxococcaceae bacterium]|nr:rhodanese-like domain-containing protein [Myxococcaceae bacterium]MBH2006629.1 rhodanese-like domain-containing protein [Myxococcaceae bacterium]